MMLAGAGLGAISVALPPRAEGSDAIILILIVVAAALGAVLVRSREALPDWLLGLAVGFGTILVTVATDQGGVSAGTADNEMLYVWICLLAFNFFTLPHAIAQLVLVGGCYAVLLVGGPTGESVTRWVVSMTTLGVAGLLVYRLRSSRDRLVGELSERARNDGLTGLLNRAALEERAGLELARARRDDSPLSLIVLDVDGFKSLNDSRGHPAGDQVLRAIAEALRRATRQVDAIARLGGDEFGVLLPGAGTEDAVLIANRLRLLAERWREAGTTLSAGVAESRGAEEFEDLWHAADAAMYEAKRAGGNAVRLAPRRHAAAAPAPLLVG
jgi:diguanylate cyclase (GGDEF)-like protein